MITTRNDDTSIDNMDDGNTRSNANNMVDHNKDTNDHSGDVMRTALSTSDAVLDLRLYGSGNDNEDNMGIEFDLNESINVNNINHDTCLNGKLSAGSQENSEMQALASYNLNEDHLERS